MHQQNLSRSLPRFPQHSPCTLLTVYTTAPFTRAAGGCRVLSLLPLVGSETKLSESISPSSGSVFVCTLHLAQCSCARLWLRRRPLVGSSLGFSDARIHLACVARRRTVASGRQETTVHQNRYYTSAQECPSLTPENRL